MTAVWALPVAAHRRAIGLVGGSLPLTLALGGVATGIGLLPSMSAYYYTPLREVFTGTLMVNAALFVLYRGGPGGRCATVIAGLTAAAIALVPMAPADGICVAISQCVMGIGPASAVHFAAAALHFAVLASISLWLFARTGRRGVHRTCGWIIVACLAGLAALSFGPRGMRDGLSFLRPVYGLEALATFAFAASWLIKAAEEPQP